MDGGQRRAKDHEEDADVVAGHDVAENLERPRSRGDVAGRTQGMVSGDRGGVAPRPAGSSMRTENEWHMNVWYMELMKNMVLAPTKKPTKMKRSAMDANG